jgi:hypothetical protein
MCFSPTNAKVIVPRTFFLSIPPALQPQISMVAAETHKENGGGGKKFAFLIIDQKIDLAC